MLTRRDFLKGLLTTIAATAIARNGVLRPSEELEAPERTIFDMAQNTWREQLVATHYWMLSITTNLKTEQQIDLYWCTVGGVMMSQWLGSFHCWPGTNTQTLGPIPLPQGPGGLWLSTKAETQVKAHPLEIEVTQGGLCSWAD